jgi:hypothetical protein
MPDAANLPITPDALQPPEDVPTPAAPELPGVAPVAEVSPPSEGIPANTSPQLKPKKRKRRTQRRIAKALMWFALLFSAVAVLSEPWLLVPVIAVGAALILWD